MLTQDMINEMVSGMVQAAKTMPDRRLEIRDERGIVVAYVQAIEQVHRRPQDMPRSLRPKERLSKRRRVAAKHEKLAARATSTASLSQ